jgi:hypothetical protein
MVMECFNFLWYWNGLVLVVLEWFSVSWLCHVPEPEKHCKYELCSPPKGSLHQSPVNNRTSLQISFLFCRDRAILALQIAQQFVEFS